MRTAEAVDRLHPRHTSALRRSCFGGCRYVAGIAAVFLAAALATPARAQAPDGAAPHYYPTVDVARARREAGSSSQRSTSFYTPPLKFRGAPGELGITTGTPQVYLVFWGSQWGTENPPGSANFSNDPSHVAPRLVALLSGIGTNSELWSGVMTQYCEGVPAGTTVCPASAPHVPYPTGGPLAGVWADTSLPTPSSSTAADLANEAINAAGHFENTTTASNRNAQYVVVSPTHTHPDGFNPSGFCAWHWDNDSARVASPYGNIAFTNLPYIPDMGESCGANFVNAGAAGLLDGVSIVEGHEYAETITDQDPGSGWLDAFGEENADKCAWVSSGNGRAQNVTFATGLFAMQSTWSNDGQQCLISHPIWGIPGLPDDYVLELSRQSNFATPGDTVTTALRATTETGNPQSISLSASGVPPDATLTFAPDVMSSDDTSTVSLETSATTPLGVYYMTLRTDGALSRTISYTVTVGTPPAPLDNGIPVPGISGPVGSDQLWQIDVPAGYGLLDFSTNDVPGDVDLYVSRGTLPTDDNYTCRSAGPLGLENCLIYNPAADRWYVRLHGAAGFFNTSLQATYTTNPKLLFSGVRLSDLSGTAGSQQFFWINVPWGKRRLSVRTSSKDGDVDLYVRLYALPGPVASDCGFPKPGRRPERCSIRWPWGGGWYVGLYGRTDYSGVTLTATYAP